MPEFVAYHDRNGNEHQQQFDDLSKKGFRMITISVYGDPDDARYAAVWVKEAGPAYVAVHGLPIGQYQSWFDTQTGKGFAPVLLSVTGTGGDAVVAAVFEKGVKPGWLAKHGLISGPEDNPTTIQFWMKKASQDGLVLRSGAIYGTSTNKRYAGVWHSEPTVKWNWRTAETSDGYQTWFDALTQLPQRPSFVTLSNEQLYFAAFRDDAIGSWEARHNMTGAKYQQEFDTLTPKGFYPICVQGGGEGSKTRYAAIFAKRHTPLPRIWTVRGTAASGLSAFDKAVKDFMQANGVRCGELTILKNATVKLQRAYTWAEEGYPITEVGSPMRLASCSKAFTCAAIQRLYDQKDLKANDKVFPLLGITQKALNSQTPSANINKITVQHLVDHAGGWDSGAASFDAVFSMRKIAKDLGLSGPPSKLDLAKYMFGEPLQFTPGTNSKYSNLGYVLLALIVEKKTGKAFSDFVRDQVLAPDGITDVFLARSRRDQKRASEVFYDDQRVGWTALEPQKDKLVPNCYGGEGWAIESMDGGGGLCSTATALARFINLHAVWGLGGRAPGAARTGGMAGVASRAQSRGDGVDFTYIFNTRNLPGMPVDDLGTKINKLLDEQKL
jgi:CubicO group peptidase (beta-lactamase class C family)